MNLLVLIICKHELFRLLTLVVQNNVQHCWRYGQVVKVFFFGPNPARGMITYCSGWIPHHQVIYIPYPPDIKRKSLRHPRKTRNQRWPPQRPREKNNFLTNGHIIECDTTFSINSGMRNRLVHLFVWSEVNNMVICHFQGNF